MDSFVSKFSTTGADNEIRRAKNIADEDDLSDALWGSQAGFGQLVQGHAFNIPSVPDVRYTCHIFPSTNHLMCYMTYFSPQRS